jgi:hypothetical protein
MKISEFILKLETASVTSPCDSQEIYEALGAACNAPYTEFKYMMRIHFRYNWKDVDEECLACLDTLMERSLSKVDNKEITTITELKVFIKQ